MEHIKVAKVRSGSQLAQTNHIQVPNVTVIRLGIATTGTVHLTTHHMIFRGEPAKEGQKRREIWICYPMIADVERRPFNPTLGHSTIRVRCRDFTFLALNFDDEQVSRDCFESIMKLTCVDSIEKLYSFVYKPGSLERRLNGWDVYDPVKEFERMGALQSGKWRMTDINNDYKFSPSYPAKLVVPESISDNVLNYGVRFRSKARIPALTYFHSFNNCTITRCAQPMVGLKQNRSPQDEKFLSAIFNTTQVEDTRGAKHDNMIVDARPTANAMAQTALGAGTENMDNYKPARKVYLGIDNIHVMRESLNKVVDVLKSGDVSPLAPNQDMLYRSNWLKHVSLILEGGVLVAKQVHYNFSHVVLHCSDGWDRTSQVASLAEICLDPYYRTIDGLITLVEKDWLSFGYRFAERCGHLSNEKHFVQISDNNNQSAQQVFSSVSHKLVKQSHVKYTAPVFHQFLDAVYQIMQQFPEQFEYNERFLRRLLYHTYSCQYGTFLYNCERERVEDRAAQRTRSVWDYFLARKREFTSDNYDPDSSAIAPSEILVPNSKDVKWWPELFGRSDKDMNSLLHRYQMGSSMPAPTVSASPPASPYLNSSAANSPTRGTTPRPQSARASEPEPTKFAGAERSSSSTDLPATATHPPLPVAADSSVEPQTTDATTNTTCNGDPLGNIQTGELESYVKRKSGSNDTVTKSLKFESMSLEGDEQKDNNGLLNRFRDTTGF